MHCLTVSDVCVVLNVFLFRVFIFFLVFFHFLFIVYLVYDYIINITRLIHISNHACSVTTFTKPLETAAGGRLQFVKNFSRQIKTIDGLPTVTGLTSRVKGGNSGTLSYFSNFAYNSGFVQHRYGALASSIILL